VGRERHESGCQFGAGRAGTEVDVGEEHVGIELGEQTCRLGRALGSAGLEPVLVQRLADEEPHGCLVLYDEHASHPSAGHIHKICDPGPRGAPTFRPTCEAYMWRA